MNTIENKTIEEIIGANFTRATVFENFSIDYTLWMHETLAKVCSYYVVELPILVFALESVRNEPLQLDFQAFDIPALIAYLVNTHHDYAKSKLPHLKNNIKKLVEKEGSLPGFYEAFEKFSIDLKKHILLEEKVIFPHILAMFNQYQNFDYESSKKLLDDQSADLLSASHTKDDDEMAELKILSASFSFKDTDSIDYKIIMTDLSHLEKDIHSHANIEDNILFQKARNIELLLKERIKIHERLAKKM